MSDEPRLQSRSISLFSAPDTAALAALGNVRGIVAVSLSADGRRLRLDYDLRLIGMEEMETLLPSLDIPLAQGVMARLSRRWAAFRETNLRSHAAIQHKCCNSLDTD